MKHRDYHTRHSGMTRWDAYLTYVFFMALAVLVIAAFGPLIGQYVMTVLHTLRHNYQ
jgi:hypothetical protein